MAVTILDDLLSYEKLSTGVLHLDLLPVKIRRMVRSAASLFRIQARGKGILLKVMEEADSIDESVVAEIDAGKITQVLRNFISNAIKFTPEGGTVEVRAFLRTVVNKREVVIQVIDSGVGMTQDQLGKIFKNIVQFNVNELQEGGGSGIGLW